METVALVLSIIATFVSIVAVVQAHQANGQTYKLDVLTKLHEVYLARLQENERLYRERMLSPETPQLLKTAGNPLERENQELQNAANEILTYLEDKLQGDPKFNFPSRREK